MAKLKELLAHATWQCEPPDWTWTDNSLDLRTGETTDLWRDTFHGFRRDDEHFLGCEVEGDLTVP